MASSSSWSDLPEEILAMIKTHLDSPSDIARFRSICPSLRSSTPVWKMTLPFPDVLIDSDTHKVISHVNQVSIYCFEPLVQPSSASPTSLLVAVEFVDGKHKFLNAITSGQIDPDTTLIPEELNICDFRITELHKVYGVQNFSKTRKVLFVSTPYYDETLLVVCASKLVFYKLENKQWVVLRKIEDMRITDIELYQGRVWGVGYEGRTVVFNSSLDATEIGPRLLPGDNDKAYFYFIESSGDLFVVEFNELAVNGIRSLSRFLSIRDLDKDELLPIKIHKLVVEENLWVEVQHLDDRVFVLAIEFPWSFSLPSQHIPARKKNCIISSAIVSDEYDNYIPKTCCIWEIETDEHNVFSHEFRNSFWRVPNWLIAGNQWE